VVGAVALLAVVGFLFHRYVMSDSPKNVVTVARTAAMRGEESGLRDCILPESLGDPASGNWVKQLSIALAKPETQIVRADVVGDDATVRIAVPHKGVTGAATRTEVGITTRRTEDGWKIDLQATMASANPQFWLAIAEEGAR
jgi:hypothetical protein